MDQGAAAWPSGLGKGLQSPVQRFDSARRLSAFSHVRGAFRVDERTECQIRWRGNGAGYMSVLSLSLRGGRSTAVDLIQRILSSRPIGTNEFGVMVLGTHGVSGPSRSVRSAWRPDGSSRSGKEIRTRRAHPSLATPLMGVSRAGGSTSAKADPA